MSESAFICLSLLKEMFQADITYQNPGLRKKQKEIENYIPLSNPTLL